MRVAGLRFLLGIAVVVSIGSMAFGGWAFVVDLRETSDTWHGLGMLFGGTVAAAGLLAGVAGVVAIRLARSRPTVARVLGALLALVGLGIAYPVIVETDIGWWPAMLPAALLLLALLPDDAPVD